MSIPSLDAIFQSPTTKLDLGKLMDGGTVICINNNYDLLGEQGSELLCPTIHCPHLGCGAEALALTRRPEEARLRLY